MDIVSSHNGVGNNPPSYPTKLGGDWTRRRAPIACIRCRKRHRKCEWLDSEERCTNCIESNESCRRVAVGEEPTVDDKSENDVKVQFQDPASHFTIRAPTHQSYSPAFAGREQHQSSQTDTGLYTFSSTDQTASCQYSAYSESRDHSLSAPTRSDDRSFRFQNSLLDPQWYFQAPLPENTPQHSSDIPGALDHHFPARGNYSDVPGPSIGTSDSVIHSQVALPASRSFSLAGQLPWTVSHPTHSPSRYSYSEALDNGAASVDSSRAVYHEEAASSESHRYRTPQVRSRVQHPQIMRSQSLRVHEQQFPNNDSQHVDNTIQGFPPNVALNQPWGDSELNIIGTASMCLCAPHLPRCAFCIQEALMH